VYVEQEFPAASKDQSLQMIHDVEAALGRDIESLEWMSPETKKLAEEKLHLMPTRWAIRISGGLSNVDDERGDALGNSFRAADFESHRQLAKIGKPVNRDEWEMSPPTVNAYYDPSMNDINFPAGILQSPVFSIPQPLVG